VAGHPPHRLERCLGEPGRPGQGHGLIPAWALRREDPRPKPCPGCQRLSTMGAKPNRGAHHDQPLRGEERRHPVRPG
jgi:hypothetical protein